MNQPTNDNTRALYINMRSHGKIQRTGDESTLQNWTSYQFTNTSLAQLLFIGSASILGVGAVMLKLFLLGDI